MFYFRTSVYNDMSRKVTYIARSVLQMHTITSE